MQTQQLSFGVGCSNSSCSGVASPASTALAGSPCAAAIAALMDKKSKGEGKLFNLCCYFKHPAAQNCLEKSITSILPKIQEKAFWDQPLFVPELLAKHCCSQEWPVLQLVRGIKGSCLLVFLHLLPNSSLLLSELPLSTGNCILEGAVSS